MIYTLLKRSIRELPTPTKVLLGLGFALPIYMIAIPLSLAPAVLFDLNTLSTSSIPTSNSSSNSSDSKEVTAKKAQKNHTVNTWILISVVAVAGAFGSIISILIRLQEYKDKDEYVGSATPILVGFAKPLIGTAFGLLIFALINSKIVNFPIPDAATFTKEQLNEETKEQLNDEIKYYFFFSLAFIFGFSERLDNDIIERIGGGFSLKKGAEDVQKTAETVNSTIPKVNKVLDHAEQILPEFKEAAEDIKHPPSNQPAIASTESSQPSGSQTQANDH